MASECPAVDTCVHSRCPTVDAFHSALPRHLLRIPIFPLVPVRPVFGHLLARSSVSPRATCMEEPHESAHARSRRGPAHRGSGFAGRAAMSETPLRTTPEVLERVSAPSNGDGAADGATASRGPVRRWLRHPLRMGALAAAILILGVVAARAYTYSLAHESTDDAFIAGDVVAVSPRVASNVAAVFVDDNQHVKKGDVLMELDPRDFAAK